VVSGTLGEFFSSFLAGGPKDLRPAGTGPRAGGGGGHISGAGLALFRHRGDFGFGKRPGAFFLGIISNIFTASGAENRGGGPISVFFIRGAWERNKGKRGKTQTGQKPFFLFFAPFSQGGGGDGGEGGGGGGEGLVFFQCFLTGEGKQGRAPTTHSQKKSQEKKGQHHRGGEGGHPGGPCGPGAVPSSGNQGVWGNRLLAGISEPHGGKGNFLKGKRRWYTFPLPPIPSSMPLLFFPPASNLYPGSFMYSALPSPPLFPLFSRPPSPNRPSRFPHLPLRPLPLSSPLPQSLESCHPPPIHLTHWLSPPRSPPHEFKLPFLPFFSSPCSPTPKPSSFSPPLVHFFRVPLCLHTYFSVYCQEGLIFPRGPRHWGERWFFFPPPTNRPKTLDREIFRPTVLCSFFFLFLQFKLCPFSGVFVSTSDNGIEKKEQIFSGRENLQGARRLFLENGRREGGTGGPHAPRGFPRPGTGGTRKGEGCDFFFLPRFGGR